MEKPKRENEFNQTNWTRQKRRRKCFLIFFLTIFCFYHWYLQYFVKCLREHATITQLQMQTDARTCLFSLVQIKRYPHSTPRLHYHMYDANLRKLLDVSQKCHMSACVGVCVAKPANRQTNWMTTREKKTEPKKCDNENTWRQNRRTHACKHFTSSHRMKLRTNAKCIQR